MLHPLWSSNSQNCQPVCQHLCRSCCEGGSGVHQIFMLPDDPAVVVKGRKSGSQLIQIGDELVGLAVCRGRGDGGGEGDQLFDEINFLLVKQTR